MRSHLLRLAVACAVGSLALGLAGCESNGDTKETSTAAATSAQPVNATCPFSGNDIKATSTSTYNGQTVGFCCDGCKGRWDKLSNDEKAEMLAKATN